MTESDLGNREAALERQSYVRHELRGSLAVMYPALSMLLDGSAGDQSLQTLRAALEDLEVLALLGRELAGAAVQKHGQRRVHDGERRAQLVPHVGLPLARGLALAKVRLSHRRSLPQAGLAGERQSFSASKISDSLPFWSKSVSPPPSSLYDFAPESSLR